MSELTAAVGLMPAWLWRVIAYLLIALGCMGFGFYKGCEHDEHLLTNYIGKEAAAASHIAKQQDRIINIQTAILVKSIQYIHDQAQTINKEIEDHVTQADNDHCTIPAGFVSVFDAGSSNVPDGTAASDGDRTPSGYSLTQVAETNAANGEILAQCRAKLKSAIEIYQEVRKARDDAIADIKAETGP